MRFYDRIIETGYVLPKEFEGKRQAIAPLFKEATVVDLTNVARYYYSGTDQEYWEVARDFPAIRSPFDVAWYEYNHGGLVRSETTGTHWEQPITAGFLVRVFERGDYREVFECDIVEEYQEKTGHHIEPRWVQEALLFLQEEKGKPAFGPVAVWRFPVRHQGGACVRPDGRALFELHSLIHPSMGEETRKAFEVGVQGLISPVLLGVTFMHTTNVVQVNHKPLEKPNRKRVKAGREPLTEYKTLELKLGGGKQTNEFGHAGRDHYGSRLHLVRGALRTYTQERPLFGKHVGRWFWKPHLRGDGGQGAVEKGYKTGG